jgi:hypothetical protein
MNAKLIAVGLVGLAVLSRSHSIGSGIQKGMQIDGQRQVLKNRQREAKLATERLKSCVQVVDAATQKPAYFFEGQAVVDVQNGRPLRPGLIICNQLGDTAVVGLDGKIEVGSVALGGKKND